MQDENTKPNTEEIEDAVEVEVEEETTAVAAEPEPPEEKAAKPEDSEQELEQYSEGVKKRISKLTAKMREAERREKAALDYAQSVQTQLQQSQQQRNSLDASFVAEFENRVKVQDELLRNQLKDAIDRGDIERQVEAQRQLAEVASQNERLKYVKAQQAQVAQIPQGQPQQAQQPQQAPAPKKPDAKAEAWAAQNEWFGADEPMTITAFSIHKQLTEVEGYDGNTDEYYAEVDRRIRSEFPHKFNGAAKSRNTPAVGSASRGTTRSNKKSVKLSPSQVAIAQKLGITKEQYAKQLLRMNES